MKHLLSILSLFACSCGFSQNDPLQNQNPELLNVRYLDLKVKRIAGSAIKLPFKKIKIIDNRYDTSKIGFVTSLGFFNGRTQAYQKVTVKNGLQKSLEDYYNEYYTQSFSDFHFSLLIVIKKLFLINSSSLYSGADNSYAKNLANYPTLKFEYYLYDDSANYFPIKRVDTTFKYSEYISKNVRLSSSYQILYYALSTMIESIDYNRYLSQLNLVIKKRTLAEVQKFNQSVFDKLILDGSPYNPGIYRSFEEFQNNKPSIKLEDLNNIELYWGYCDGKNIYSFYHHKKLFKCGNTFQYFGDKIQAFGNDIFGGSDGASPRIKAISTPLQIDMETGKPY